MKKEFAFGTKFRILRRGVRRVQTLFCLMLIGERLWGNSVQRAGQAEFRILQNV